jgi:AraC-like DNA-binding protein
MSPENLSRILKSFRGKTANKWISDALIVEAKKMLNNKEINIQQVADELNFGDQSSFGKFFKKHTGYTPIAYKNKMTSGKVVFKN